VPSGDEILRLLEGMVCGDESGSKEPKPIEKLKTDGKKNKRSGRGLLRKDKQWLITSCGKRKVFSLGCRI
jgi:hypothetical protein